MLAVALSDVAPFHLHLDVVGLVVAMIVLYEGGLARLATAYAPRGEPAVTRRQRIAFYSGVGSILAFTTWPIHDIGEQSLYMFHMVEHLAYALIAPPLILWGTPWWLTRVFVKPILPVLRLLTRPFVALFVFNATLGLIHVPAVVELMLTSELAHFGFHAALMVTAFLMWWPVVGPIPDLPQLEPFHKMGYLFLQSLVPTVPASFLTLGDTPLYKIYETFPRLWGISAHTDQVIAGLIMKIGGGLLLWGFIAGVFFTWVANERELDDRVKRTVTTAR